MERHRAAHTQATQYALTPALTEHAQSVLQHAPHSALTALLGRYATTEHASPKQAAHLIAIATQDSIAAAEFARLPYALRTVIVMMQTPAPLTHARMQIPALLPAPTLMWQMERAALAAHARVEYALQLHKQHANARMGSHAERATLEIHRGTAMQARIRCRTAQDAAVPAGRAV